MKLSKKIIFGIFVLVAIAQLAAPLSMIAEQEEIVTDGATYKFRSRPIDPYDPFRGKYITLYFDQNRAKVEHPEKWVDIEFGYFPIENDNEGFAIVQSPLLSPPNDRDYLKMKLNNYYGSNDSIVRYSLPFNKFYMNEDEALNAEKEYRRVNRDRNKENAYAVVKILEGEAVLQDVIIGGKSAKELM